LVIFDCEHEFENSGGNPNHIQLLRDSVGRGERTMPTSGIRLNAFKDDWLRFVLYKLSTGCSKPADLATNHIQFVTFNYDTSLERRLFTGLSAISQFDKREVRSFMDTSNRFLHVYGSIRERIDETWRPINFGNTTSYNSDFHNSASALNEVYRASEGIRTIDGEDKLKNEEALKNATEAIQKAEVIYLLGFGFDRQNIQRLGLTSLRPAPKHPVRTVFFTNFGGHNRVSMSAGEALAGDATAFLKGNMSVNPEQWIENHHVRFRYEMSTKNVYAAIAEDFESMEAL